MLWEVRGNCLRTLTSINKWWSILPQRSPLGPTQHLLWSSVLQSSHLRHSERTNHNGTDWRLLAQNNRMGRGNYSGLGFEWHNCNKQGQQRSLTLNWVYIWICEGNQRMKPHLRSSEIQIQHQQFILWIKTFCFQEEQQPLIWLRQN